MKDAETIQKKSYMWSYFWFLLYPFYACITTYISMWEQRCLCYTWNRAQQNFIHTHNFKSVAGFYLANKCLEMTKVNTKSIRHPKIFTSLCLFLTFLIPVSFYYSLWSISWNKKKCMRSVSSNVHSKRRKRQKKLNLNSMANAKMKCMYALKIRALNI